MFGTYIVFDNQDIHTESVSAMVLLMNVPYRDGSNQSGWSFCTTIYYYNWKYYTGVLSNKLSVVRKALTYSLKFL